MTCTATGFPAPDVIVWFHNNSVVDNSSAVLIITEVVDTYVTTSTLVTESAQAEDAGDYYCIAISPRQEYNNVTSETALIYTLSKI